MKSLNKGLCFILELAMLASVGYAGFKMGRIRWAAMMLGIGLPALVIVFWTIFMAPRAAHRIGWPWRQITATFLFLSSAGALYLAGSGTWAVLLAALSLLCGAGMLLWKQ